MRKYNDDTKKNILSLDSKEVKSDLDKELNDTSIIDQHKLTNISETIEGIEFNIFEY